MYGTALLPMVHLPQPTQQQYHSESWQHALSICGVLSSIDSQHNKDHYSTPHTSACTPYNVLGTCLFMFLKRDTRTKKLPQRNFSEFYQELFCQQRSECSMILKRFRHTVPYLVRIPASEVLRSTLHNFLERDGDQTYLLLLETVLVPNRHHLDRPGETTNGEELLWWNTSARLSTPRCKTYHLPAWCDGSIH